MLLMNVPYKIILLLLRKTYRPSRCRCHFAEHRYTSKTSVKRRLALLYGWHSIDCNNTLWRVVQRRHDLSTSDQKNVCFVFLCEKASFAVSACSVPLQGSSKLNEQVPFFVTGCTRTHNSDVGTASIQSTEFTVQGD